MPIDLWGPWRLEKDGAKTVGLQMVQEAVSELLTFELISDIARYFSVFATDNKHRKIKIPFVFLFIAVLVQYLFTFDSLIDVMMFNIFASFLIFTEIQERLTC